MASVDPRKFREAEYSTKEKQEIGAQTEAEEMTHDEKIKADQTEDTEEFEVEHLREKLSGTIAELKADP